MISIVRFVNCFGMEITCVLSAASGVVAIFTADMCTGSPDEKLMQVVHIKEQSMNHLLYDMSKYYVEVSKF